MSAVPRSQETQLSARRRHFFARNPNERSWLIQPFARTVIRNSCAIIVIYAIAVFAMTDTLSVGLGALFAGLGLFSVFFCTHQSRQYFAPLVITIFYLLGYVLTISNVLLSEDEIRDAEFNPLNYVILTDSNVFAVVLVVAAGLGGVLTASVLAERLLVPWRRHRIGVGAPIELRNFSMTEVYTWAWLWLWFAFSAGLILLMWYWQVGRTGLVGQTELPFRLAGFLIYFRMIGIPFVGTLLLDVCLRRAWKKAATAVLMMLVIVGALSALGANSRGAFAFTLLPAIAYLLFTSRRGNMSETLFWKFLAVALITSIPLVFIVSLARDAIFEYQSWDLSSSLRWLTDLGASDFDFLAMLQLFGNLATARIGGLQQLVAVIDAEPSDIQFPIQMLMGTITDDDFESLSASILGFIPFTDNLVGTGIAFGMWGQLFLSHSYLLVYFGTLLLVGIIICFEEVFFRIGLRSGALLFSMLLAIQFWGSPSAFSLVRFIYLLLVCYLIAAYVVKPKRIVDPGIQR